MWLRNLFENMKAGVQTTRKPIPNEKVCQDFAANAYQYCTELYGAPGDANTLYCLLNGMDDKLSSCFCSLGWYVIVLSPGLETVEQQCMVIGHEMYHRFTMHRKGLRCQIWVDELLAFLTSLWFLQQQGFSEYADAFIEGYTNSPGKIDLRVLREFRRPLWYIRLKNLGPVYPEDFYTEIARLGVALKSMVSRNDLCRIIKANSLEDWIASLPAEKQYGVCRILEVSSDGKKPPENNTNLLKFRKALRARGDRQAAVSEFQELAGLQPTNGAAFFYLARAYEDAEDSDAELSSYMKAYALDYSDCWLLNNVGFIYWEKQEYDAAAEWFQKTAECKPDWAKAHYWLGRSLNNQGHVREAHEAWNKVLTLDDEEFTELAEKAMKENPLPDRVDAGKTGD